MVKNLTKIIRQIVIFGKKILFNESFLVDFHNTKLSGGCYSVI